MYRRLRGEVGFGRENHFMGELIPRVTTDVFIIRLECRAQKNGLSDLDSPLA